jgi:PAS domain S-box-containing protein
VITAVYAILTVFVTHLIDWGKTKTAYFSLLFITTSSLLLLCYVEGMRSGIYLFFFPCIFNFAFLTDYVGKKSTVFTYIVFLTALGITITFYPEVSSLQKMSESLYRTNFMSNIGISFILVSWMSFSLARENQRRHGILQNKEVFLNTIFNTSMQGEIIVDGENGLITNYNHHSSFLFGPNDPTYILTGRNACDLFYELSLEDGEKLYQEMCHPTKNWEGELTCVRRDGTFFPAQVRVANFQYNGKPYKKITVNDITERKQMLNELKDAKSKAEKSAAVKSQFLSNMSHELRTPLNGIIGSTNLLLQEKTLPDQREQLNILKFSSEHMLSLINDILDLSKLDANKVDLEKIAIELPDFVKTIAGPFLNQFRDKGLGLSVKVDERIRVPVVGDPTRLNQVLANLLSNALKFTSSGTVTLEIIAQEIKSENIRLEFSVSDTGIGISEEKKKKVFEQFIQAESNTTRRFGGTGLGLTISQKLVRLMGGELKVDSKYNQGSRFYFEITLPVYRSRTKVFVNNKSTLENTHQLKDLKVLLAEDNPINMLIASRFLEKWGVPHSKAKNGVEAVSLCAQQEFDLILMDLEMPEMDGYDALNAIRKANSRIPAIAFTAAVFENMKEKLTASGFDDYIQKPFQPEDLHARLVKFSREFP